MIIYLFVPIALFALGLVYAVLVDSRLNNEFRLLAVLIYGAVAVLSLIIIATNI